MKSFEGEWRGRFEKFARRHQEEHLISGWSREGLQRRVELVSELLASRAPERPVDALDLGCGGGTYVRLLSAVGHRVVGVDYSRPSLLRAVEADPKRNGRYLQGEAYHLPFRDGSFDLVLSIGIFLALSNPERALDEISRVLRPGGTVILEHLNAHELVGGVTRGYAELVGKPDPVRAYAPGRVRGWLETRGLRPIARVGVYLPPRRPPWLASLIVRTRMLEIARRVPPFSTMAAHAFLTMAEKGI